MVEKETNQKRINRRKETCEVFTPEDLVNKMLDKLPEDVWMDFSKILLEPCAGNGNFVVAIVKRRLLYCSNEEDITNALKTIYAVELMPDNVWEMKQRIYKLIPNITSKQRDIIDHNIVCADFFKWDFENWKPIEEELTLFNF